MTEGRTRLQLLEGGLGSTQALLLHESIRPPRESISAHHLEPCAGELSMAYKATERRLHTLLEDRTRIARDLHDCVLQSLYVIGLNIETSRRSPESQTAESKESDKITVQQINQLIHEVREMIHELESGTVQEFDLASELNRLRTTHEFTRQLRVKLDLQRTALEVLTTEEEREILNIVREALSNCARHAHATQAIVSIRMKDSKIRVSIKDDGIGFSTAAGQPRGYGLANMEARAKQLGGKLWIQSETGEGTQVTAEFSLEPLLSPV